MFFMNGVIAKPPCELRFPNICKNKWKWKEKRGFFQTFFSGMSIKSSK